MKDFFSRLWSGLRDVIKELSWIAFFVFFALTGLFLLMLLSVQTSIPDTTVSTERIEEMEAEIERLDSLLILVLQNSNEILAREKGIIE